MFHQSCFKERNNIYCCCQNPNLTTTQLNLNLVGFDRIITLHPPRPHTITTGTLLLPEKNNPRGLKFCRQPHQAKLTTIQHNFNPTIFWGDGSYILPLGLTLPIFFRQKNFGSKRFGFEIIVVKKTGRVNQRGRIYDPPPRK